jgi:protein-L-isoaspartate(D-aspartate) O-methyltransferase
MSQRPRFPVKLDDTRKPASGRAAPVKPAPAKVVLAKVVTVQPAAAKPVAAQTRALKPASAKTAPLSMGKALVQPVSAAARPLGVGLDSGAVRARMVQKLAEQGIQDNTVLTAMGQVERHRFVESALANQAYEDTSLPIGLGQTISKPNVVARMIELLRMGTTGKLGRVLEIGTGCGYQAAVLSHVASEVYSIERLRGLHEKARENLRHFRLANVHLIFGDGMLGYPKGAPYAGIISAAGGDAVPQAWLDQLAIGGRLVAPTITPAGHQALVVMHKTEQGIERSVLDAVHFVPLKSGIA